MENNSEYGKNGEIKHSGIPWGQVGIAVAAFGIAILETQIAGREWIIYFCLFILSISFALMIWQSIAGAWIRSKWRIYSDQRTLKHSLPKYERTYEKARIMKDLAEKVQNIEWGALRPTGHLNIQSRFHDINRILSSLFTNSPANLIYLNAALRDCYDSVDNYLNTCDFLIVERKVAYKNEHEKADVIRLVKRFEDFCFEHDNLCGEINKNLKTVSLIPFYSSGYSFVPKEVVTTHDSSENNSER